MKIEEESTVKMEWLSSIDSTTLSHSELHALSLSSLSSFDLKSTREIITPKIDPSTFNHSAGSHRQTYSRPRRLCRVAPLLPTPALPSDHRIIVDYLKQFIREDPKFDMVELLPPAIPSPPVMMFSGEVRKRKRGRKPKVKIHLDERGMGILNKNEVAIDLDTLFNVEHPFAAELARRTEGMNSEEELLGFLSDLVGQWGSRRRKRRIVDVADFGDVLPLDWKLLLSLKRKDGRAWIYCRRYIRDLQGNKLTGQIPDEIGNCGELVHVDLSDNQLYGDIPFSISRLKLLEFLNLKNNQLTGPIPSTLSQIPNLKTIDLARNKFIGEIPRLLYWNEVLQYLDVRGNNLTGTIP